jgi:hypothetical protein
MMTIDDVLGLAADRLDDAIAEDVRVFEAAMLGDGVGAEAADEALAWRREALWLWRLEMLDALDAWLRRLPRYDVH